MAVNVYAYVCSVLVLQLCLCCGHPHCHYACVRVYEVVKTRLKC